MKYAFAGLALLSAATLQGCSSGGGGDYYYAAPAPAYDKDYENYKLEKKMQREMKKEFGEKQLEKLGRDLEKKYGK